MESKINQSDLAVELSQSRGISKKEAESFMDNFFSIIEEYVIREKSVKIKGLGTFKLIDVNDRESVNVNTGERIVIAGHSKISFTPDNALKDQVNSPFAEFETVPLSDNVDIAMMEKIEPIEPAKPSVSEPAEIIEPVKPVEPEKTVEPEKPVEPVKPVEPEKPKPESHVFRNCVWTTVTLVLVILSYTVGYYKIIPMPVLDSARQTKTETQEITKPEKPLEAPKRTETQKVEPASTDSTAIYKKLAQQYEQVEGGEYLIVGELDHVHNMRVGETLYKIAGKELGCQKLMPYIMVFNKYPDDIVLHPGDPIKLPKLVKK